MRATIVGAGVSGLTTGWSLLRAGWDVEIVARETYESTVSMVAAAVWSTTSAQPEASARRWALTSRERFEALAMDPATGVAPLRQRVLHRVDPGPRWWEQTPYERRLDPAELPPGYGAGFEVDGFVIEPPLYLRWLTEQVAALGGVISVAEVERLDDLDGDVMVDCAGLGAARLAGDPTVHPIRGQVVAVANPGIGDSVADESDPERIAYVYPRSREIVLGGTRHVGRSDADPDPEETERILADCVALDPRVAGLTVSDVRVGLRPGRPTVRVERGRLADGRVVVHNYGHGGAGYILSWGCAADVVDLAAAAVD